MVAAWVTLLRRGGYNIVHSHSGHGWSGVYYVDPGRIDTESKNAGQLELIDPRVGVDAHPLPGKPFHRRMRFAPQAGLMFMFPSWLRHYVHPYEGPDARIAISFNVDYTEPEPGSA